MRRVLQTLSACVLGLAWALPLHAEAEAKNILATQKKLYSQINEELIIRDFFQDRREGFFLDVGAWHWMNKSTTLYLERHLDWSGIAVDALPEVAQGYAMMRPRTRFFNHIVTDHSGTVEKVYRAGELTSTDKSHIDLFPGAEERVKKIYGEFGSVDVPTITLNELLDANDVDSIDFLSMDIEQGEPAALAGFDIERFRPELVCIEANPNVRERISAYFEEHGYERIDAYLKHDPVNWYFTPKKEPSVKPAKN